MLTRRGLFGCFAGGVVAGLASTPQPQRAGMYGPVDIARYYRLRQQGITLRVIHQGRDVTNNCIFADDSGLGRALVYKRTYDGHRYIDVNTGDAAKEWLTGISFRADVLPPTQYREATQVGPPTPTARQSL